MDDDDAVRWAIRLDAGLLATDEQQALDTWLAADERRQGSLLRAEAALAYLDRGRALTEPSLERLETNAQHFMGRRAFLVGGSVAGLTAAGILGVIMALPRSLAIETAIGEVRRIPLADGSMASINTNSKIAVAMLDKQRHITIEDGEAWFQVAHDKRRPFIVEAGDVRVEAVGTAFSVRRREDGVDVLVTEGVVETWVVGREKDKSRITAGSKSFVADLTPDIAVVEASGDIDRALAWRSGELALNGESLDYAVSELNRYNVRKLVIDDRRLGRELLVGYFRTDQPEEFGRAVAEIMGAKVSIEGYAIHLSR